MPDSPIPKSMVGRIRRAVRKEYKRREDKYYAYGPPYKAEYVGVGAGAGGGFGGRQPRPTAATDHDQHHEALQPSPVPSPLSARHISRVPANSPPPNPPQPTHRPRYGGNIHEETNKPKMNRSDIHQLLLDGADPRLGDKRVG